MKVLIALAVLSIFASAQKPEVTAESRPAPRGSLRVSISWVGDAPATRPASIPKDWKARNPDDAKVCESCETRGTLIDESLLVDPKSKGVEGIVVSLSQLVDGVQDLPAIPAKPVVRNEGCRFSPHIVLSTPSDPLTVTNEDPFTHAISVAGLGGASLTSEVIQPKGKVEIGKLSARGIYVLTCPLHGWMRGYVVVLKQGAAGVTSRDGTTLLSGLATGRRTVSIWHETLGSKRVEVDVSVDKETVLSLTQKDFPAR